MAETLFINPASPDEKDINRAAGIIASGGMAVIPTTGLYGLAADAYNPAAVERVFALKGREREKSLLVLAQNMEQVIALVDDFGPMAQKLADAFWPGRLTLVLKAKKNAPATLVSANGSIGVRLTAHPVARALIKALGRPVTGTSANPSGLPAPWDVAQLAQGIKQGAEIILDAGALAGGPGSSVLDISGPIPRLLREGAVSRRAISQVLGAEIAGEQTKA
ncbi:MAG: L-threonylcarbamoyladenylate synthase [Desulfatibacillaceae bacterium]|nr:L-threonylcarbamoyladenylate synthase [Desulfatibacillaceae bacterium]